MTTRIERSNAFKRDYRRELKTHGRSLGDILDEALVMLIIEGKLPERYRNHKLSGAWGGMWECHLKPDLLLLYEVISEDNDDECLFLFRLGSHSKLFG